ncbi:hypothetical protein ACXN5S_11360 [Pseudoroseicyclus sp. H15]
MKHFLPNFRTALAGLVLPALLSFPAAAIAQDDNPLCGSDRAVDREIIEYGLEGLYTVRHGPGYVITSGMMMPHPSSLEPQQGYLSVDDDGQFWLRPVGGEGVNVPLEWVDSGTWDFAQSPPLPDGVELAEGAELPELNYDGQTLAERAGCAISDLPRFVGEADFTSGGMTMHFTLHLWLVSEKQLLGFQQVDAVANGIPVLERRPFDMRSIPDPADDR